jgi:hypothetical protein
MTKKLKVPVVGDASEEFAGALLGDPRRNERLALIVAAVQANPGASLPTIAGGEGALEGTYRFFRSEHVSAEAIQAAHARCSAARASEVDGVLVAHDSTEFNFGEFRTELGRAGRGRSKGFYGHFSLAVTAGEEHFPLGVVAQESIFRDRKRNRSKTQDERQFDPANESLRWGRGKDRAEEVLGSKRPIHLMDREADHYLLLAEMQHAGSRFVVRMSEDRVLAEGCETHTAREALEIVEPAAWREVKLSPRRRSSLPSYRKNYPERDERTSLLEFSATQVTLRRPSSSRQSPHQTVTLNLVHVREVDPPEGAKPVEWRLWTSLPVDTEKQIEAVVDHYRARWIIEEFFKALKTGCDFESRQLRSRASLLKALAVFTAVAWRMLALRTAAKVTPDKPASALLNVLQLRCLVGLLAKRKVVLPKNPTAREALLGIAKLAGHQTNNGDPGWQLISRGFDRLLSAEENYAMFVEDFLTTGKM